MLNHTVTGRAYGGVDVGQTVCQRVGPGEDSDRIPPSVRVGDDARLIAHCGHGSRLRGNQYIARESRRQAVRPDFACLGPDHVAITENRHGRGGYLVVGDEVGQLFLDPSTDLCQRIHYEKSLLVENGNSLSLFDAAAQKIVENDETCMQLGSIAQSAVLAAGCIGPCESRAK
nr:hypothetical protein [Arthrobacter sp. 35W]